MAENIPKNPIRFGLFATKPQRKWAIAALICVIIAGTLGRLSVIVLRNLTDVITTHPLNIHTVWIWAIAYPLLFFITESIWRVSGFTGMRWFVGFSRTAYQSLYEYLSSHSKEYFSSRFAGSLSNKIANAVDGAEYLFVQFLWKFLPLIMRLFWYVIFALLSSWLLGLIIAVWAAVFIGVNVLFVKKLRPLAHEVAQSQSTLKGRIVDSLSNISLVHEYAYISGEREYIRKFVQKQYRAGLTHWWYSEWVLTINGVLVAIFTLAMIASSIYLFQNHLITIGVVVMVIAIVSDISDSFFSIGQELSNATGFYSTAHEGLNEILHKHLIADSPDARELKVTKGAISIESIDFEYDQTRVFDDFSLLIPPGQKIGLVGRSGAGKTTFASLLLRHFDVQGGAIKIDGQSIQDVTLESLRRVIAFVPQDTSLFHRTIRENIRYSNPNSSNSQVESAAAHAQAHEFISKLPKGYDTLVGERGVKLSGGQRQRITIARAFLKNAPILVLDEATSSLDSESEQAIQSSLEDLMKGRTVIAIAHRLSTLKRMDRIIVIEDGKIVEDGAPQKLLESRESVFKKLWESQVQGFIVDEES